LLQRMSPLLTQADIGQGWWMGHIIRVHFSFEGQG
jgi:hypothetical protein